MNELLQYIIKALVTKPDEVEIKGDNADGMINLSLKVAPDDMGMVIGKNGQTIRAIRKLLIARALAENSNLRVNLNLEEIS